MAESRNPKQDIHFPKNSRCMSKSLKINYQRVRGLHNERNSLNDNILVQNGQNDLQFLWAMQTFKKKKKKEKKHVKRYTPFV